MRPTRLVVVLVVACGVLVGAAPVRAQQSPPAEVSWQSAGDSYSSGEGVAKNKGPCAQSEDAYGPVAAQTLVDDDHGWKITNRTFTACTGHLVEDYFHARGDSAPNTSSLWAWGREQGGPERVDVISLSFGGNDIGFADVISDCLIGVADSWTDYITLPPALATAGSFTGCDISEADLNQRADDLLDPPNRNCATNRRTDKVYNCDIALDGRRGTITDFYWDLVTNRLTDRGRLYVVGYPRIFADTDQWPAWSAVACAGVKRGDTQKLGRSAEHLNNKLQEAVRRANDALGEERVVFIDRFASYRDGQHELCGRGVDWLNGIALSRGDGTIRHLTSFHPNEAGHAATAVQLVDRANTTFPRTPTATSSGPTWDEIKNASIPEACTHPPTTLVDGRDVTLSEYQGYFELNRSLENGNTGLVAGVPSDAGPLTAVVVSCNAGGVGWPNQVMFFSEGGRYYGSTDLYDADWEQFGFFGPGRGGVTSISLEGPEVEVRTSAERDSDTSCCPTGAAVLRLRPSGGAIKITSITEVPGD